MPSIFEERIMDSKFGVTKYENLIEDQIEKYLLPSGKFFCKILKYKLGKLALMTSPTLYFLVWLEFLQSHTSALLLLSLLMDSLGLT